MKVTNAEVVSTDRVARIPGGVYITYTSKQNVVKGSNVKIQIDDSTHYFEVTDISINGDDLDVKAREVGYWAHKFGRMSYFDLRTIIGLDVIRVDDSETISKIREMSCWC